MIEPTRLKIVDIDPAIPGINAPALTATTISCGMIASIMPLNV